MKKYIYFLLLSSFFICSEAHLSMANEKHASVTHHQHKTAKKTIKKETPPPVHHPAQIEVFEGHTNENDYVITLYPYHGGSSLIAYNAQACQANSYGTTVINPKTPSNIEFTSTEDPHCKILLQKTNDKTLKVVSETLSCKTWHGDSCSFTTISTLNRVYPQ